MPSRPISNEKDSPSPVVLFDGVCKLCNGSVNFLIRHDRQAQLKFAPLQSDFGRSVIDKHGKDSNALDSIMLLEGDRLSGKSTAIIRSSKYLGGFWPLCITALIIPPFIRDFIYNVVAKNRYRWFGKYDSYRPPDPGLEDRFYN